MGTAYGESSIRHVLMMSFGIDFFHFKGKPDRNDMYWDILQERQDFDAWAGAFDQYLWIDRRQGTVVAQFSTGQPMLFTEGESGAGPAEFAVVMRTMASCETFQ